MAEGLTNHLFQSRIVASSAGTRPEKVHSLAIMAMGEIGIDISKHRSKHLDEFKGHNFDLVITVCDGANEICPFFPGAKEQEHAGFPDPSAVEGTEEERLKAFRQTRDDIILFLRDRFEGM